MSPSPSLELHASVDYERRLMDTNTRSTGCSVHCRQRTCWETLSLLIFHSFSKSRDRFRSDGRLGCRRQRTSRNKSRVGNRTCSRFPVGAAAAAFLHLWISVAHGATATVCC